MRFFSLSWLFIGWTHHRTPPNSGPEEVLVENPSELHNSLCLSFMMTDHHRCRAGSSELDASGGSATGPRHLMPFRGMLRTRSVDGETPLADVEIGPLISAGLSRSASAPVDRKMRNGPTRR